MNPQKLDFTKPITTRDGRKVRILCTDGPNKTYPVVGYVGENTYEYHWMNNGSIGLSRSELDLDLINPLIKHKIEFWVNVYPEGYMPGNVSSSFKAKGDADYAAHKSRLACLHFTREYEEGEGL